MEQPHTGKEIIDSAVEASSGEWKPSPGLIYPLLGRLLDEGLIEESKNGKYQITDEGKTILTDLKNWKMNMQQSDEHNDAIDGYGQIYGNGYFRASHYSR